MQWLETWTNGTITYKVAFDGAAGVYTGRLTVETRYNGQLLSVSAINLEDFYASIRDKGFKKV